jgi:hypothetical protein
MPLEIVPAAELGHEKISVRSPIVGWRVEQERYVARSAVGRRQRGANA